jgi:hypothetical protein
MDEYIVDVVMDNKQEQLKTYSASQIEALDSMISFDGVDKIIKITRVQDNKSWDFDNDDLEKLRELRGLVDDDKLILQTLRGYN